MFLFYIFYFILMPSFCFAYLDPGTGSLLIYALVGIATTLVFALKNVFYNIRNLFSKNKIKSSEEYGIVFYSEGKKYFHIFKSIINELINEKIKFTYITSDVDDPIFQYKSEYVNPMSFSSEMKTISFLNCIKADVIISTTPHLDIYMWKKSKNVKKYIHIFHAPTGIDFYEKYALSFYDIIFSVGTFTEIGQKSLDEKRHLPQTQYYNIGCTYYDYMLKEYNEKKSELSYIKSKDKKTILYAPTWGKNRSSFFSSGIDIMSHLLEKGFDVIFRPHPQFYISHVKELNDFIEKFSHFENLTIDNEQTPVLSMIKSDLLITDFSGVLFDYAYLSEKPVLLLNVSTALDGYEAEELQPLNSSFDINASLELAHQLSEDEIKRIDSFVIDILNNPNTKEKIKEFKEKNIFNFGNAGKKAAEQIINIYNNLEGAK